MWCVSGRSSTCPISAGTGGRAPEIPPYCPCRLAPGPSAAENSSAMSLYWSCVCAFSDRPWLLTLTQCSSRLWSAPADNACSCRARSCCAASAAYSSSHGRCARLAVFWMGRSWLWAAMGLGARSPSLLTGGALCLRLFRSCLRGSGFSAPLSPFWLRFRSAAGETRLAEDACYQSWFCRLPYSVGGS